MPDTVFAADRGYNSKETISFTNERLGATGIGTHKRSLDYPFVFGNGPITKRHKGKFVSEKRCRAVYSAVRKPSGTNGKNVEAIVYRGSYSGRIAAMYHNDMHGFGSHTFTMIPKSGFRGAYCEANITQFQRVHTSEPQSTRSRSAHFLPQKIESTLRNVKHLTIQQSEDTAWFLSRAFKFTSRKTSSFLSTVTSNNDMNIRVMAKVLCSKTLVHGAQSLSSNLLTAEADIRKK